MLATMEATMYEDNRGALKNIKSNMTLDFGGPKTKQQKFVHGQLLSSPDLGLLKLASPELERMIIQQNGMVTTTPTPTQFLFPKSVSEEQEAYARGFVDALAELHTGKTEAPSGVPNNTTASQSQSAQQMQTSVSYATLTTVAAPNVSAKSQAQASFSTTTPLPGSVVPSSASRQNVTMSSGSYIQQQQVNGLVSQATPMSSRTQSPLVHMSVPTATSSANNLMANGRLMQLKEEEPQTVPCLGNTPPLSPINMESQERIKLERKRARNRVAARKCRTRKLERISRLEDRVTDLKDQNSDLTHTASALREQVFKLKQQIMEHVNSGCQVMLSPNLV